MEIYSVKNEKLSFFNRPIYVESHNEALSYIQNILMNDADRALLGLKSYLALYYLGNIDFVSGVISDCGDPVFICNLEEIFNSIPEERIPRTERQIAESISKLYSELNSLKEVVSDHDCKALCRNYRDKKNV